MSIASAAHRVTRGNNPSRVLFPGLIRRSHRVPLYFRLKRAASVSRRWADDLRKLVHEFRSSDAPLRTQVLVQQALKAVAERIERMGQE